MYSSLLSRQYALVLHFYITQMQFEFMKKGKKCNLEFQLTALVVLLNTNTNHCVGASPHAIVQ